ncbi:hypothetical protein HO133_006418 [Letharia lupina]|uniref:Uncharacterized protein n=1 Tax=Letharia lupina TaxID=560253 RepID=A0A8H6C7E3_9LECA|nr:uncharacterized protein HO133_006418 [Letharia lupina]KAF6218006.1 hypothetical protein HO133_006418 [Letharia lupina]
MAPLDFDKSANVASLAGTWLGTIFTGVGLLAVLTQLRSLLLYVTAENRRWKERAAGAWASCILMDQLPSNGIQEGVIPTFSGWLQHFYLQEKTIATSQDDHGVCGKSSWSNLFGRMDIKAADLDAYGGLRPQLAPTRKRVISGRNLWIRPLRSGLGDALVENGSISYGFSAPEFAALIILCGFRPGDFAPQSSRHSTSFYGQMRVADYGPFSQIANFDSHHGFRDAIRSVTTGMRDVPVAHSLDLAFGMIPIEGRHGRGWVIPREWNTVPDMQFHRSSTEVWSGYALPQQLKTIQYSFERFVGTGELAVADYAQRNDVFEADDVLVMENLISSSGLTSVAQWSAGKSGPRSANIARELLNATHAITAIQPWGLLPVLPEHMVVAVKLILDPFYKTREFTIRVLQRELELIPDKTFRSEGRTGEELSQSLNLVTGDKERFFIDEKHSFLTSTYHEAMSMVFRHKNIKLEDIRISLAAAVGSKLFWLREGAEETEPFQRNVRLYLERCYLQAEETEKSRNAPGWAVDIYANYLWGWITDSIPADPELTNYFRRRVFLA